MLLVWQEDTVVASLVVLMTISKDSDWCRMDKGFEKGYKRVREYKSAAAKEWIGFWFVKKTQLWKDSAGGRYFW